MVEHGSLLIHHVLGFLQISFNLTFLFVNHFVSYFAPGARISVFQPLTISLHFPSNKVHIILIMSCGVVCVWPRTNSDTIVSMFIWFCYLEWMIYGGKLIWSDLLTSKIYKVEGTALISVRIFVNKINTYRLKRWWYGPRAKLSNIARVKYSIVTSHLHLHLLLLRW